MEESAGWRTSQSDIGIKNLIRKINTVIRLNTREREREKLRNGVGRLVETEGKKERT